MKSLVYTGKCFFCTLVKGIVLREGLSTETIGVKFGPKQSAAYVSGTWRAAKQKFLMQQTGDMLI
jgi:hypothetical protein